MNGGDDNDDDIDDDGEQPDVVSLSQKKGDHSHATGSSSSSGSGSGGNARDTTYFGYYAQLNNQQNMLQDAVRTGTYQWAISRNPSNFRDKVVLDVGAGSGILSFFAVQTGARKVYAVEASDVAAFAKTLVHHNGMDKTIAVLQGKLEDLSLPEKVDVIVSEPMGVLLVHERMIETFVQARIDWLKPGGAMFPCRSSIFLAPFTDQFLYAETMSKVRFWQQEDFYGVNLSSLAAQGLDHHFSQPVVGCFDSRILLAAASEYEIDLMSVSIEQLRDFTIDFSFMATYTGVMHGIAGWFDVLFQGAETKVILSTSPFAQKTHWYQIRFLLKNPIAVNAGQQLRGKMHLAANDQRSYDIDLWIEVVGTTVTAMQTFHLYEQQYWYPQVPENTGNLPWNPETQNMYPPV